MKNAPVRKFTAADLDFHAAVRRYRELEKTIQRASATVPMFMMCPCGNRGALAVEGRPASEPCAICSTCFDAGGEA